MYKNLTYGDKVFANYRDLNVPEDGAECESFTIIAIDSLLNYKNKYYLHVYSDNCANKFVGKQMIDYLFEPDKN